MGEKRQPLAGSIRELAWSEPGFDRALAAVVLAREGAGGGVEASNVGGWHSAPDLHAWEEPPVPELVARIRGAVPAGDLRLQAWANVMRRGDYHNAHRHGEAVWAGVYYVDAGDGRGGRIQFARGLESCKLEPRTGRMLVFPGDLLHNVEPYEGEGARISVAFNLFR